MNYTESLTHGATSSIVMYVPPLYSFTTSNITTFTCTNHLRVYTHHSSRQPDLWSPGRWCFDLLPAPSIRKHEVERVHGRNVPTDEVRLHPFTSFHNLSSASRAALMRGANSRRRDSQQHPPYRWVSGALVRQGPGPGKPRLLVLFDVCICFRPKWGPHHLS